MKIGIDLVSISQFKKLKKSDYKHWRHIFSPEEWKYAFGDVHAPEHLAGIFAAKEAAMKATGPVGQEHFRSFEVAHTADGTPFINMQNFSLSISHNNDNAVALVIAT